MSLIRNASVKKIQEVIGNNGNYVEIPPFQRSFSWTGDQAKDLFDDINDFFKEHRGKKMLGAEYFLGAIVAYWHNGNTLRLIDGQQRIASLTILLACIRDRLAQLGDQESANALQFDFIQEKIRRARGGEVRNRLTLNHDDKEYFTALVQVYPRAKRIAAPKFASEKKIYQVKNKFDGKTCFGARLADKSVDEQIDYLLELSDVITNNLTVVLVEADSDDGASDVFEVLNERGLGLSTVDLVRNFLLSKARGEAEQDSVVLKWSVVLAMSDNAAKIQNFLRHFWILRHGDVKARGLYRVIKDELKKQFQKKLTTAVQFSEELANSAQNYQNLLEASTASSAFNAALITVSKLDATPIYPVLLAAIEQQNEAEALRICTALISHYVRWTIIGRRESTELEKQLFDLAQAIHKGLAVDGALSQIRAFSLNDVEFREAFASAQLTKAGQRRPILDALENFMRKEAGKDELRPDDALHVEHIYPQNPDQSWKKLDDCDEWVNRIGNLTLLTGSRNARIGNKDFKTVKLPEMKRSELEVNAFVMKQKAWGPDQIAERQRILAEIAPSVWPLPTDQPVKKVAKRTLAKRSATKQATSRKSAAKAPGPARGRARG